MVDEESDRPDPDALLRRIQAEEERASRARSSRSSSASPRASARPTRCSRPRASCRPRAATSWSAGSRRTAATRPPRCCSGSRSCRARAIEYRGATLEEFDLDAALARKPGVLLARRARAHQRAGLPPRQALAGRARAARRRHRRVHDAQRPARREPERRRRADHRRAGARDGPRRDRSTAPTRSSWSTSRPRSCSQRLREGKVYLPRAGASAPRAAFFRRGNLLALRELALRRTAERVDADVQAYRREHGIEATWPIGERILVCVGAGARVGAADPRGAAHGGGPARAVGRRPRSSAPAPRRSASADRERLEAHLRLAESLGATVVRLVGRAPERGAARLRARAQRHAHRGRQADALALARSPARLAARRARARQRRDRRARDRGRRGARAPRRRPARDASRSRWREIAAAAALVGVATGASAARADRLLALPDVAMLYLLAVMLVARALRARRRRSLAAALSVAAYDFFFVPPLLHVRGLRLALPAHLRDDVRGRAVVIEHAHAAHPPAGARRRRARAAHGRAARAQRASSAARSTSARRRARSRATLARGLRGAAWRCCSPDAAGALAPIAVAGELPLDAPELAVARWASSTASRRAPGPTRCRARASAACRCAPAPRVARRAGARGADAARALDARGPRPARGLRAPGCARARARAARRASARAPRCARRPRSCAARCSRRSRTICARRSRRSPAPRARCATTRRSPTPSSAASCSTRSSRRPSGSSGCVANLLDMTRLESGGRRARSASGCRSRSSSAPR